MVEINVVKWVLMTGSINHLWFHFKKLQTQKETSQIYPHIKSAILVNPYLSIMSSPDLSSPTPGSLFINRWDVLLPDLAKYRSHEIWIKSCPIALKFDRHLHSRSVDVHVKVHNRFGPFETIYQGSRLHKILFQSNYCFVNRGPVYTLLPSVIERG